MRKFHFGRFFLYLCILFFACFWFSGGDQITQVIDANDLKKEVKQALPSAAAAAIDDLTAPSPAEQEVSETYWDRIYRLAALRSAVDEKIHTRNFVKLEKISLPLQQAVVATEDSRFYNHPGFDVEGIMRAGLVNLQHGQIEEGGSTITQQLIKNLFLSRDRSLSRKAEELALAIDMEMRYSKDEILELYLNTIYFGSGFYGISEASMGYFAKLPAELTLAESAMLAGLPNAPSLYSPYVDFNAAKSRQNIVLDRMAQTRYITPETAKRAKADILPLAE